ncbi:hypothetical protein DS891_06090 [Pseudoalteromonas sp. JC28]|nr:hypothetical protein [Pseudoalteromonas sp. JC28]
MVMAEAFSAIQEGMVAAMVEMAEVVNASNHIWLSAKEFMYKLFINRNTGIKSQLQLRCFSLKKIKKWTERQKRINV